MKSISNNSSRGYRLEALESRLLLSADGLGYRLPGHEDLMPVSVEAAEVVEVPSNFAKTTTAANELAVPDSLDMFGTATSGEVVHIQVPSDNSNSQVQPESVTRAEEQAKVTAKLADQGVTRTETIAVENFTGSIGSNGADESGQTVTSKLVGNLTVGNAPPTEVVSSQSIAVKSLSLKSGESASTSLSSSLADLNSFVIGKLSDYVSGALSGTRTFSPGTLSLGSFLTLLSPSLTFSNIVVSAGSVVSGSVSIQASGATLFDGQSFSASITDGSDDDSLAISGTYDAAAKTYSVALDVFLLTVGEAVRVSASFRHGHLRPR